GDNIVWGTAADGDNIVWGTDCGGADCRNNIVWGTAADGDNIVWGTTSDGDNIVWGTGGDSMARLPSTQLDWYRLLLDEQFDIWWVAHEFGDSFVSQDGPHPPKFPKGDWPKSPWRR
ncbi:MAG: hypothetical protein ACREMY_07495, partial [bacterium]